MQTAAPDSESAPAGLELRAGDSIRLVTKYRDRMSLKITDIREKELAGITLKPGKHESRPKGETIVVAYDDLALVEMRHFSAGKTILVVPAIIVSAGVTARIVPSFAPVHAVPAEPFQ